mgnify:CR=1 FL=1
MYVTQFAFSSFFLAGQERKIDYGLEDKREVTDRWSNSRNYKLRCSTDVLNEDYAFSNCRF